MFTCTTGLRLAFMPPRDLGHGVPQWPVSPLPCNTQHKTSSASPVHDATSPASLDEGINNEQQAASPCAGAACVLCMSTSTQDLTAQVSGGCKHACGYYAVAGVMMWVKSRCLTVAAQR